MSGGSRSRGAAPAPGIRSVIVVAALLLTAASATAQTRTPGRIEIGGGLRLIGGIPFAGVVSEQTTRGGSQALFETQTTLGRSTGPLATIGVRFARVFRAETSFGYNDARLVTAISDDREGAADATAHAPVRQFLLEGSLVVEARRWRAGPLVPFGGGGVGYVRQLYDGRTLLETGHFSSIGGGVLLEHTPPRVGAVKATGLRIDVRALRLRDGVISDGASHWAPAIVAQVFARF